MDDFDFDFHGSTKKIISLVKNLPQADGKKFGHALHRVDSRGDKKKRRFNKHPRKLSGKDSEELLVIKQPSRHPILTDSSDEYCDVTIRTDDHLQDDDHILRNLKDSKLLENHKHRDLEDERVFRNKIRNKHKKDGQIFKSHQLEKLTGKDERKKLKDNKILEKLSDKEDENFLRNLKDSKILQKLTSKEDEHIHKDSKLASEEDENLLRNLRDSKLTSKQDEHFLRNLKELENLGDLKDSKILEKLKDLEEEHILRNLGKITSKHVKDLEDEQVYTSLKESKILKDIEEDERVLKNGDAAGYARDHRRKLKEQEASEKLSKNVKELENREKKLDDSSVELERKLERQVKEKEPRVKEEPKIYIDLKLEGIINKSVQTIDDIRELIESGIDPPDGSEDFCRRKKRASEFAIRFSRIHLYQLNRLWGDIENILKPGPPTNRNGNVALNQKFYMAHQTLYQALQAYLKHLPSSIIIGLPDKLREVLHHASNLCEVYKRHSDFNAQGDGQDNIIENYENKCKILRDQIDLKVSIGPSSSQSHTNLSVLGYRTSKSRIKQGKINKFSMYHSVPVRADVYWKKAIASIAQKKFDVPSRYKTATYKHRPPPPPPPPPQPAVVEKPHRKTCHKRSDKKSAIPELPNDIDNVTTLMQHQEEKQQSKMWNLAQSFFHKISKDNQAMSQGEYECILEHFITMIKGSKKEHKNLQPEHKEEVVQKMLEEKLGAPLDKMEFEEFVEKLLQCVNNNNDSEEIERVYIEDLPSEVKSTSKSRKPSKERRQTLSVTGPKNAQLICIKDDESLIAPSEDERPNDGSEKTKSGNELIYRERLDGESQSKTKTKLARIGKQGLKPLGMLPKDTIVRIIEYKLQFHKEKKNECMYKKSGNMSPWILVERISEQLLEEVLQSITRDIQVDEILRKIYAHEFK